MSECPKCGLDLKFGVEGGFEVCPGVDLKICDYCPDHPHIMDGRCTLCDKPESEIMAEWEGRVFDYYADIGKAIAKGELPADYLERE